MTTLTVTAKGQITLPHELLQFLGIAPGQQIELDKLANGVLALHAKTHQGLEAFAGCLPPPDKVSSLEAMNAVIANGWAGQASKSRSTPTSTCWCAGTVNIKKSKQRRTSTV